jgi:2-phosphosulfolactate phosphatase
MIGRMSKIFRVAFLPRLLPETWYENVKTAVVIDTLRFTTTACQGLAAGATKVSVASEVEQARALASEQERPSLLCGERECRPIPGFDLGNSPYEYTSASVGGASLVFTTTNGTLAVTAAAGAKHIYLGALVNRSAIARSLLASPAAWIICSGTDGEIAGEDILAAGAILEKLRQLDPTVEFGNDAAILAVECWKPYERLETERRHAAIVDAFRKYRGGSNLIENNYAADLDFAACVDKLSVVPVSLPTHTHTFVLEPHTRT